jgi:peptidoglycan hydrolase-like protein with peptidoglycan-binding domain
MRNAALLLVTVALVACNRERTHTTPAPTASTARDTSGTWVAQGSDLSPEQVRMVQRALGDRGFPVELSGSYDPQTRTALSDFQRSRGLPSTGNLNSDTAAALGLDPNQVMPVRGRDQTVGTGENVPATGAPKAGDNAPGMPPPGESPAAPGGAPAPGSPSGTTSPSTTEPAPATPPDTTTTPRY